MATHAAYRHVIDEMTDNDLWMVADLVREMTASPAWKLVTASIAAHEQKMLDRLLNESTRPEDIPRLRGLLDGLRSAERAAETITGRAEEREAEARQRLAAQEHAHA